MAKCDLMQTHQAMAMAVLGWSAEVFGKVMCFRSAPQADLHTNVLEASVLDLRCDPFRPFIERSADTTRAAFEADLIAYFHLRPAKLATAQAGTRFPPTQEHRGRGLTRSSASLILRPVATIPGLAPAMSSRDETLVIFAERGHCGVLAAPDSGATSLARTAHRHTLACSRAGFQGEREKRWLETG